MEDLWPKDIGGTRYETPVSILQKQADLLGKKTNNLVKADTSQGTTNNGRFIYHFYIVAPTLGNYRYRLFSIEHDVDFYPLIIYLDEALGDELDIEPVEAPTQRRLTVESAVRNFLGADQAQPSVNYILSADTKEDFVNILKEILSSQRTQQVVSSLLSQMAPEQLEMSN